MTATTTWEHQIGEWIGAFLNRQIDGRELWRLVIAHRARHTIALAEDSPAWALLNRLTDAFKTSLDDETARRAYAGNASPRQVALVGPPRSPLTSRQPLTPPGESFAPDPG